jgi:hypothetical protein
VVADCVAFQRLPPALESPSTHLNARFCVYLLITLTARGPLLARLLTPSTGALGVLDDVRPCIFLRAIVLVILGNPFGMELAQPCGTSFFAVCFFPRTDRIDNEVTDNGTPKFFCDDRPGPKHRFRADDSTSTGARLGSGTSSKQDCPMLVGKPKRPMFGSEKAQRWQTKRPGNFWGVRAFCEPFCEKIREVPISSVNPKPSTRFRVRVSQ